jgi:outer membrane protein assembly factor BamB
VEGNAWIDRDEQGRARAILELGWHYAPGKRHPRDAATVVFRRSVDGGKTWTGEVTPPQWQFTAEHAGKKWPRGVSEGALVRAANGDLVAALRTDMPPRFFDGPHDDSLEGTAISISRDDGKTWSKMHFLFEAGRHHANLQRLPDGDLVCTLIVRDDIQNGKLASDRRGCDALLSKDHGRTWNLDRRFELDRFDYRRQDGYWVDGKCGHVASVVLADGHVLSAYGQYLLGAAVLIKWKPNAGARASDWPQFRGPNASGRPATEAPLPAEVGPGTNVLWKTALPPGHSSPVVVGDRVYLTAVRQKRLVTLALDRQSGKLLWEREAPARALEKVHAIGSHAQSTPAADREGVVSFFGSAGLFCYDRADGLRWQLPLGPFQNDFGAASSPVLAGDRVLLCQDHDEHSFLTALDRRTGKTLWKTDRSEFLRGFATPVIWDVAGRQQVVVAGTLRVIGYDWETGQEVWTVRGLARTICATPVVGDDGRLYVSGWAAGGDPGAAIAVAPFDEALRSLDRDGNGKLERAELTGHPFGERFTQVDTDGDGSITRAEYERFRELFQKGRNAVLAIRPGGRGDVTASHVAWANTRQVPFCASPLYLGGLVYTVKDGGLLACLDRRDGKPLKVARLPDAGNYYSSPVAGDGKIYVVNERGFLTVVWAGRDWEVLSTSDFGEAVYATPAIADGRIYLRTSGHLYCFGVAGERNKASE